MSALMNEEKIVFVIICNLKKFESRKDKWKYKFSVYVIRPFIIIHISFVLYLYTMPLNVLKD